MNARSFRTAAWLGWKIESNWTDPFLFTVYSIVKPLAGAAILVVMYSIITNGAFTNPLFPYIYLGNAFYMYVGAVMTGVPRLVPAPGRTLTVAVAVTLPAALVAVRV